MWLGLLCRILLDFFLSQTKYPLYGMIEVCIPEYCFPRTGFFQLKNTGKVPSWTSGNIFFPVLTQCRYLGLAFSHQNGTELVEKCVIVTVPTKKSLEWYCYFQTPNTIPDLDLDLDIYFMINTCFVWYKIINLKGPNKYLKPLKKRIQIHIGGDETRSGYLC